MKILLVDDDSLEIFLALKILRMEFQAEAFKTVSEAVEWAKINDFDVLLSDNYVANNVQAADVLNALVAIKGKTFKSVVLTNHVDDQITATILAAGFDGIIDKPLSLDKLKKAAGLI
jgi:CheY-like chemotaxis protein